MSEAARSLARAVGNVAEKVADRKGSQVTRATITMLGGSPGARVFTAVQHDTGAELTEMQVTIGQGLATYDVNIGLVVGDTLACMEMRPGDFVAIDCESDTDLGPTGTDGHLYPALDLYPGDDVILG